LETRPSPPKPAAEITCEITPQYRNMRYWLEDDMRPVSWPREGTARWGSKPLSGPVRGGTRRVAF